MKNVGLGASLSYSNNIKVSLPSHGSFEKYKHSCLIGLSQSLRHQFQIYNFVGF